MEPPRQKLFARLALAAFVVLCGGWLLTLDFDKKISTDVLDLIPSGEQSPEANLVRNLAGDIQARVVLIALTDPASPLEAAQQFVATLARSPLYDEVTLMGDSDAQRKLGGYLYEHRFELLLPAWLARQERAFAATGQTATAYPAWLAEKTAADLENFLNRPEAAAMEQLIPNDPLLLIPRLVEQGMALNGGDGQATGAHALVWARLAVSPFKEESQKPAFAAIEQALAQVRQQFPGITLQWTGVNRFAAASRDRIENEMSLLNIFSLVAVLAVAVLFVRRTWKILHLVPIILLSILGAWTVSTLVYDKLHVLVFVIGSLLAGVAIDYGFYIYMQPARTPDETYGSKLRRLLKPLLASCLTTVIGFSLLMFSDLPLIRQVGLFVGAGLLCALGAAMLYFAQLEKPFLESRTFGTFRSGSRPRRFAVLGAFVLAVLIALAGPFRLNWRDSIQDLGIKTPDVTENDTQVRALFGDNEGKTPFITHGKTLAEARAHLETFTRSIEAASPGTNAASLGLIVPTEEDFSRQPARLQSLAAFEAELRLALDRHGFTADSFDGFFKAWSQLTTQPSTATYPSLYQGLTPFLTGPLALFYQPKGDMPWFLSLVDKKDAILPADNPHTLGVNQLQSLNTLFNRYRWSALKLSLIGLGLVVASVFVIYPPRRGVRIALIPAGACFFVFGLFGVIGLELNLFNLLGAFLGVCLSHNYAIFSSDNANDGTAPPVSIRLSALCTAASFGVLGFSHIPVIHSLGMTVALIVLTALTVVELEPLARRPRA